MTIGDASAWFVTENDYETRKIERILKSQSLCFIGYNFRNLIPPKLKLTNTFFKYHPKTVDDTTISRKPHAGLLPVKRLYINNSRFSLFYEFRSCLWRTVQGNNLLYLRCHWLLFRKGKIRVLTDLWGGVKDCYIHWPCPRGHSLNLKL